MIANGETPDPVMSGFLYMKALIGRYGVAGTADLRTLADRVVQQGLYPNYRAAIEAIEEGMGLPVTMPMSREVADFSTPRTGGKGS